MSYKCYGDNYNDNDEIYYRNLSLDNDLSEIFLINTLVWLCLDELNRVERYMLTFKCDMLTWCRY